MNLKIPLLPKSLRWGGVAVVAIAILYFSLITIPPDTPGTTGPLWDKQLHFAAYAGLTMATAYATANTKVGSKQRVALVFGGVFLYGIGIELGQGLAPDRYVSSLDVVANMFGILLGGVWFIVERLTGYQSWDR